MKKKLTAVQYWRIALASSIGVCLALVGIIWLSGENETVDALNGGQRLLITLENGAIEGTQAPENLTKISALKQAASKTSEKPANPMAAASATSAPVATATASATDTSTPAAATSTAAAPSAATDTMTASGTATPHAAHDTIAVTTDALLEKTSAGMVPTIAPDGTKPWHYYSKHYSHKGHLPMIGIVISGLGQNKSSTEMAVKLPENVSLSFSPYAHDVGIWASSARAVGHEVFLDLPLEPSNYPAADPGPYGLITTIGNQANATHLEWLMSRAQGYVGFLTPQNDAYTSNPESLTTLMEVLNRRGLVLLMGHEPAKSEISDLLNASKATYSIADIWVDEDLSSASIQARLVTLEKIAAKRGYAIGTAQGFPLTLQQIADWAAKLDKEGYELVPVSFVTSIKFPN